MRPARGYRLRNLWTHAATSVGQTFAATVPGQTTLLYRVSLPADSGHRDQRRRLIDDTLAAVGDA